MASWKKAKWWLVLALSPGMGCGDDNVAGLSPVSGTAAALTATPGAKLVASDGSQSFGLSVAVSGDTAVIGAPHKQDNSIGAAYVFVRDAAGNWTQNAKLLAIDGAANNDFGLSVALNGDTAVIGAPGNAPMSWAAGAAYVFVRDAAGNWTQSAKLLPTGGTGSGYFGSPVALDGDTALIGAMDRDANSNTFGAAYVFARDTGGIWTQNAKLQPADGGANNLFGQSVALGHDTAVIGDAYDGERGRLAGSAYVFVRDAGGAWTQNAKLLAPDGVEGDTFGWSVAFDGDTAVIGAPNDDDNGWASGSAYVFVRDAGGDWSQQAKLPAPDAIVQDMFGWSIALVGDTAVIGTVGDSSTQGSAWIFTRTSSTWSQQAKLLAWDGVANDAFGWSVALRDNTAVVGNFRGSAYTFFLGNYTFTGFLPPLENPPVLNTAKAGQTIPVKWQLVDGSGSYISDLSVVTGLRYQRTVACGAAVENPLVDAGASGSSGLRYDSASNQFVFAWKTAPSLAGACYRFIVELYRFGRHEVDIKLK